MRAPLHRQTEKIGACFADPFANGEGAETIDTFTSPEGRRRRVYRPVSRLTHGAARRVNRDRGGALQPSTSSIAQEPNRLTRPAFYFAAVSASGQKRRW
jgi:hypothetical protein